MKTVATIEARMRSTRLPGKVLHPLLGRPMLDLLLERVRRAHRVDEVVVATTTHPDDDAIETLARQLGVGCFRGSEEDVLDRVLRAAHSVNAELIVELTGDCPLIDPTVIDRLVRVYQTREFDYVSNTLQRTYPRGLDTQVFSTITLEETSRLTQDPADREHVSLYICEHPDRFRLHNVSSGLPAKYWDMRLTVDTLQDYQLVQSIYGQLYPANPRFGLTEVLDLVERQPELLAINRDVVQKSPR